MARTRRTTEDPPADEQLSLLPPSRPKGKLGRVRLSEISDYAAVPSPDLVALVREIGVLEPVILTRGDGESYTVLAGVRRVVAARAANETWIDAKIVDGIDYDVVRLVGGQRRENAGADLLALEQMLESPALRGLAAEDLGAALREVSRTFGWPGAKLRKLLSLQNLTPAWRLALVSGSISASVAHSLVRLDSVKAQEALFDVYMRQGKLTAKDIANEREALYGRLGLEPALPAFEPPPAPVDVARIRPSILSAGQRLALLIQNEEVMDALGALAAGKFDPARILQEIAVFIDTAAELVRSPSADEEADAVLPEPVGAI